MTASVYPIVDGKKLLDRAFVMRDARGTRAAAAWLEKQGISPELGIIALRGSNRARHYGVDTGRICQRGWNK